jgi:DNA polymerase-3 subunit alpha
MKRNSFTFSPIHFRSYFSLLKECLSPEDICSYAEKNGFPAAGITDINNVYGLIRFIKAAKRSGIKPVSGVVVCLAGREILTYQHNNSLHCIAKLLLF